MKRYFNFLLEKKEKDTEKVYEYGCAMIYFDFDELEDIHDKIKEDDVHDEGLETEPHLTLLYGLHPDEVKDKEVMDTILDFDLEDVELLLYNVSLFENDEYDVLKFDVKQNMDKYKKKDDVLYKINKKLSDFPHTTDFPDYHPHSTIGYLEPGKGKEYVDKLKDKEYVVKPSKIVYSKPNEDGSDKVQKTKKIKNED